MVEFLSYFAVTASKGLRMTFDQFLNIYKIDLIKPLLYLSFVGDELAQVVGCPWIMRDSGGSLSQNHWQGDLGLTAVGQDDTGGGTHLNSG